MQEFNSQVSDLVEAIKCKVEEMTDAQSGSQGVDKLAEALAKAQAEITPPKKKCKVDFVNTKGQRVKYNYADLADVLEAIRQPLSKNGLSVVHQMSGNDKGFGLKTKLMHASGQFLDTWYPLPDPEHSEIKPQEFGSALTYARRYSVSSLVGIASDEDDDGQNAAVRPPPNQNKGASAPSRKPPDSPPPATSKPNTTGSATPAKNHAPAMPELLEHIDQLALERSIQESEVKYLVTNGYEFKGSGLPLWIAEEIIGLLEKPDTTASTIMATAVRMQNDRKAKALLGGGESQPAKPPPTSSGKKEPGDYVIDIENSSNKGKKISELPETVLKDAINWARTEMKRVPPAKGISKVVEFNKNATAFMKEMGVTI